MAEYLKRDEVLSAADIITVQTREYGTIDVVPVEYLSDLPTADVVEVVRCKDCKCYKEYLHHSTKESTGWGKCTKIEMDIDLSVNDFCCYGERK